MASRSSTLRFSEFRQGIFLARMLDPGLSMNRAIDRGLTVRKEIDDWQRNMERVEQEDAGHVGGGSRADRISGIVLFVLMVGGWIALLGVVFGVVVWAL